MPHDTLTVNSNDNFPLQMDSSVFWSFEESDGNDCTLYYDWVVHGFTDEDYIISRFTMATVTIPYEELVAVLEQNNQN